MEKIFVDPGYIYLPRRATVFYTVVGSSIVVTLYDKIKKYGGISHFIRPIRLNSVENKPLFAYPAITGLFNMMKLRGSKTDNLKASIIGGAENRDAIDFIKNLAIENVKAAIEIIEYKKIDIVKKDIGGFKGRKVAFHSGTGEIIVTKSEKIRDGDWYPDLNGKNIR